MLVLIFLGAKLFQVNELGACLSFNTKNMLDDRLSWDPITKMAEYDADLIITCSTFSDYCGKYGSTECLQTSHIISNNEYIYKNIEFSFSSLEHYDHSCLVCSKEDYTLSTIIFNFFIFCQIFNEMSSRRLNNEINFLQGMEKNKMFIGIIIFSVIVQIIIVQFGGSFMKTTPLTVMQWIISVSLASGTLLVGVLMRYIPITEDPQSFVIVNNSSGNNNRSGYTMDTNDSSKSISLSKKHNKSKNKTKIDSEKKTETEDLTARLLVKI